MNQGSPDRHRGLKRRLTALPDIIYEGAVQWATGGVLAAILVALVAAWRFDSVLWRPIPAWIAGMALVGSVGVTALLLHLSGRTVRRKNDESEQRASTLEVAWSDTNRLTGLDASLFLLIPSLVPALNRGGAIRQVMDEYLRDCRGFFGLDVRRASIFMPTAEGQHLLPWIGHEMPEASLQRTRCYIGASLAPGQQRGVAGEAYMREAVQVAHLEQDPETGQWRCDHPQYINFDRPGRLPQYLACAVVPMIGNDEGPPLGVLCLDSTSRSTFDSADRHDVLWSLAERGADVLSLYRELERHSLPPV